MSVNIRGKCNSCCVPGCNSNSTFSFRDRGGRITTFKLPRDEARRKEWIQAIPKRKYPPTVNHNVCILHFNEEDFSRNNRRIDLKKSAVPSIFPFVNGQRNDESTDICDEVWNEYVAHKKESTKRPCEQQVGDDLPAPAADISRILIERLRIPGSKYFGIDTAEITIQPDSDIESDVCEPKATIKKQTQRTTKRKHSKRIKFDEEGSAASVQSTDNCDVTNSPLTVLEEEEEEEEEDSSYQINQFSDDSVSAIIPSDNEDKFGAMVSSKLQQMSPLQRLMSQKILSEILLRGQLGMLKSSLQSPVLVTGYMKTNGMANTSNDLVVSVCGDQGGDNDSAAGEDGCDPLMFQVKEETNRNTDLEPLDFVKAETYWSDDDDNDED